MELWPPIFIVAILLEVLVIRSSKFKSNHGVLLLSCLGLSLFLSACSLDYRYYDARKTSSYSLDFSDQSTQAEEVSLSSNNHKIYGVLIHAKSGNTTSVPTIMYFHGDDKDIDKYVPRLDDLYPLDMNIFIFDFQGYGKSEGSPSLSAIKQNSEDALIYLKTRTDVIDPDRMIYYAFSIGAVFALDLATRVQMPKVLITESIPASSDQSVRQNLKLGIPGSFFFDETFDNVDLIRKITCPILMFHGDHDQTLSYADHAVPLFNAAPSPKVTYTVKGAGHSNLIDTLGASTYRKDIQDFLTDQGI